MQKMPYTWERYLMQTTLVLFKFYYIYYYKLKMITSRRELSLSVPPLNHGCFSKYKSNIPIVENFESRKSVTEKTKSSIIL